MGLTAYKARRYEEALAYFTTAFETTKADATCLENVLLAFDKLSRHQDAYKYLTRYASDFPKNQDYSGRFGLPERASR